MLKLGKVGLIGIVVRRGLPDQIEHVPDKHRAYGMNGLVPIKPSVVSARPPPAPDCFTCHPTVPT
jgi:hypothetical protein